MAINMFDSRTNESAFFTPLLRRLHPKMNSSSSPDSPDASAETRSVAGRRQEPAGQRSIRRQNLSLVLREVIERGPLSRAGIAEAVGLTRSTVSSLVGELMDRGLLSDLGRAPVTGVGRPGQLVAISDKTVVGLGLEINVDYLAACILDLTGGVRFERFLLHENRGTPVQAVCDALGDLARNALSEAKARRLTPVGATVAVPGLVEVETGMLLTAPNLGWERTSVRTEVAARLRQPRLYLTADNEANLAALGELWLGRGREWRDFIHLSGEIGVGGAVVVGGELLRSGSGLGGELGHLSIDPDGPECPCGSRGCLERVVGQEALLRAAGLDAEVGTSIGVPDGGVRLLAESAERGDERTLDALAEAGRALGLACAAAANLLAPNTVALGGIFAPLFDWLAIPLREELAKRSFVSRCSGAEVVRSNLGAAAAVRGAASLTLHAVCADPYLVGPAEL
jgi:predicted NBD/HSP70 family sugar kinase/predicted XRE-type DNA-binding protein